MSERFADIILPLPLANSYTYKIPEELSESVKLGMRVVVPFGSKKIYTGIVRYVHAVPPKVSSVKEIIALLDNAPILRRPQLPFWEWIANYYMAFIGDVYTAAVPAGLKLESETTITLNSDFEADAPFSEKELRIYNALSDNKPHSIKELTRITGFKTILPTVKNLMDQGAVSLSEELRAAYKPKRLTCVRLADDVTNDEQLQTIFDLLHRSKKQLNLLMVYLELSRHLTKTGSREVSKKELLEQSGSSAAVFDALVEKKILHTYSKEISRLDSTQTALQPLAVLNSFQKTAYRSLLSQLKEKNVVLLHGVTSSGKTEIYIHLIAETLKLGRQVLYLVPEIALTTQLTQRLERVFGNKLGVYHSKFSDNERVEIWNNLLNDKGYEIILGVRSSVFLPFRDLGLVIVDEEHESSYKQYDPAPRYHARNAAIVLANMHGAKTVLGSATPAIESYHNALAGKYGLVELTQRHEEIELPKVQTVDLKEAYRKKRITGHFTDELVEKITLALSNKEQVILFQNRRGYAPYIECKQCAYVPRCPHCDVSLTYHKHFDMITCHYCGYTSKVPANCPSCHTPSLQTKGFGTEQIEEEIHALFPDAKAARLDLDTVRTKKGFEKIIRDFESHSIDILIGTQMVTKGLDFGDVSLVGILNAGNLLFYPDFRAHERAFQLMAQVSGRAGRKSKQGLVVLQTPETDHPVIRQVIAHDYKGMFATQMRERHDFRYPPYFRLINIIIRHKDAGVNNHAAALIADELKKLLGTRVLGPNNPPVGRIQNWYIKHILLKIENAASPDAVKEIIRNVVSGIQSDGRFKSLQVNYDVDPM
ncbi:replication restart helicase PriA [Paludibacter jiangxiensis]|uniref:Replication restart protein PriA n=1 Tax=Paludibacter jiangxiensis TaxID=681398 RepID=A0A170ZEI8_9BACT|nr:primosomal protein N' [Paludibacter jiangxiensis]GAT62592.1 primosomal protein N', superfamily II helicase [Paludibacter jiangxiensis]